MNDQIRANSIGLAAIAAVAIAGSYCKAAQAQVISGSQISFVNVPSGSNQYGAVVLQAPAGNITSIGFTYAGATLTFSKEALDEGSDWYLANAGEVFSANTIAAGQFPILFTDENFFRPTLTIPLGTFYLGMNTGTGATNAPTFRDVYGWLELDNTGTQLIPVDNAVAYGDYGIIIGTTTAIVPEPATAALLLAAGPLLLIRQRRARLTRGQK